MKTIKTKYYHFHEIAAEAQEAGVKGQTARQLMYMYAKAIELETPTILELGTARGASTTMFLQACEITKGRLVSVDIADCSDLSDLESWQFVQSDSTDVQTILKAAGYLAAGIDILYVDSRHHIVHVEKDH